VAIIPARYESTRFPGKPLALIAGRPMVQHVYERTRAVPRVARTLVATDDERIATAVRRFGGEVLMTRPTHPSGTDRIAEVAADLDCEVVVNVQGDFPFLEPDMVDRTIAPLQATPDLPMATLKVPIVDPAELANPNVVKVVTGVDGYACISPAVRCHTGATRRQGRCWGIATSGCTCIGATSCCGSRNSRRRRSSRPRSWSNCGPLESGFRIKVVETADAGVEVDTPQDLERAQAHAAGQGGR